MWSMPSGYGGRRYILQRLVYQLKINCLIKMSLTVISLGPNRHYTGDQEKPFWCIKLCLKCVFQQKAVFKIFYEIVRK